VTLGLAPGKRSSRKERSMEHGLLIKWGALVPGREAQAIDLFAEGTEYFGKKLAEGAITFFEPFFFGSGDLEEWQGAFFIKGPVDKVFAMIQEEGYLYLMDKAFYLVEHLTVHHLTVGSAVTDQLVRSAKVRAELGIAV
jgi:hypothetical protein